MQRARRWWDAWIRRELREPYPGGFPQAFCEINYRHPRWILACITKSAPMQHVEDEFRRREGAYYRRGYKGDW